MTKIKLDIDYGKRSDRETTSDTAVTVNYIYRAVNNYYNKGLGGQFLRIWGRLQRKLDNALDNDLKEIEIEDSEKDFIETAIKEAPFDPSIAKFVMQFQDELFVSDVKPIKKPIRSINPDQDER